MRFQSATLIFLLLLSVFGPHRIASACDNFQKGGDPNYQPTPFTPKCGGLGLTLLYDEAHNNYYTISPGPEFLLGRYAPFAELAAAEGISVRTTSSRLTDGAMLQGINLLVIAGAAGEGFFLFDNQQWNPAIGVPAFKDTELKTIYQFVARGGSLLIAANHAPLSDPVSDVLSVFGVETRDSSVLNGGVLSFASTHPIALGVSSIRTGGGAALHPSRGTRVVTYPPSVVGYAEVLPFTPGVQTMWRFESNLPNVFAIDLERDFGVQGGGRIVVLAHAGDFTSQQEFCGTTPFGSPQDDLVYNQQLALNVLRWLLKVS